MVVFSDYGNCEEVLLHNIKPVTADMLVRKKMHYTWQHFSCWEKQTAYLVGMLRIMAGGRGRVLRQSTGIPPRRGRTAPAHQADAAVLPAAEGTWLMRPQVNGTVFFFFNPSLFSWCFILQTFNCSFFSLSLHPPVRLSLIPGDGRPDFLQQSRVLPEFLCVHVRLQRTFQRAWTSCKNPNTCSCQFC